MWGSIGLVFVWVVEVWLIYGGRKSLVFKREHRNRLGFCVGGRD